MSATVVIVGGGPGGMMLGYLLARAGIKVSVLEAHGDFDRDFRGDSLHPYTLELLDHLGLADDLLRLDHVRARYFRFHTPTGTIVTADYGKVQSRFPYVALMPQARFLEFLADRACRLPSFSLLMDAKVTELVGGEDNSVIRGVGYRSRDGMHQCGAHVVVAVDGRFSRIRRLANLPAESLNATTDLVWFRLPRLDTDPPDADTDLYFGYGNYVGLLGATGSWQVGYSIAKGGYADLRDAGVGEIHDFLHRHVGWLGDRIETFTDFNQSTLLSVELSRAQTWYRPGLLMLGDAAHVISPVGGNGILMAIQDAVAAANHLISALVVGPVTTADLAAVQHDREAAIIRVQDAQVRVERRADDARRAGRPLIPAGLLKLISAVPGTRGRAARANAYGPNPPHLVHM